MTVTPAAPGLPRLTIALLVLLGAGAGVCVCVCARAQDGVPAPPSAAPAPAPAPGLFTRIEAPPASAFWLDSGFATWHFDQGKHLNGGNRGFGAEYRFSGTLTATAGGFVNSDRAWSDYAGVIWQPYALGPVRLGAAIAAFNGYPKMRAGGWFPAAIPTLSYEYRRIGINFGIVPSYKDRLYGGISVQLKLQLF